MNTGNRIGGYELLEKLGEGGMAEVWKARSIALERVVAIKFLLERFTTDPDLQQRFLQEGRIQARLQHPQIVAVLHAGSENGRAFLVTDYVGGKSLEELLRIHGGKPLPVEEVLSISYDVLSALEFAHNLPQGAIVHRDVKPSNILLDDKGRARLADFGIAVALNEDRKTKTGFALGSVFYMSPEQIQTPRAIDWRSDIYSFGCVLYEMLTGRPPFGGDTDSDFTIKQAHVQTPPEPMRKWNPQVPFEFEWIVFRALSKDRERRFTSAAEMADALRPIVPGPRREKRTPTVVEHVPAPHKSERDMSRPRSVEAEKIDEVKDPEPARRETRMEDAQKNPRPAWMQWFWPDFKTRQSARQAINIAANIYLFAALIALGYAFFGRLGESESYFLVESAVGCILFSLGIWRAWKIAIIGAMIPLLHPFFWILIPLLVRALRAANLLKELPERDDQSQTSTTPDLKAEKLHARNEPRVVPLRRDVGLDDAEGDARPAWKQLLWPRFEDMQSADRAINIAAFTILMLCLAVACWAFFGEMSNLDRWIPLLAAAVSGVLALGISRRWKVAIVAAMVLSGLACVGFGVTFLSGFSYNDPLSLLLLGLICPILLIVIAVSICTLRDWKWAGGIWTLVRVCGLAALFMLGIFYIGFRPALVLSPIYALLAVGAWRRWKIAQYTAIVLSALVVVYFNLQLPGVFLVYSHLGSMATAIAVVVVPALARALSAASGYPKLCREAAFLGQKNLS